MNWIPHPVVLKGEHVRLVPLHSDHFPALLKIATHPAIWEHLPFDGTQSEILKSELQFAILCRVKGEQYPFSIFENKTDKIVGSTRWFDIHPQHKKLEIGWTWMSPEYWGSGLNTEAQLLQLQFCFEQLKTQRVQLKTRATNLRSIKAIEKIGAIFEGTMRKDRMMSNGEPRNSCMFSIIDDEWPDIKLKLQKMLGRSS